jgi:hypothetical protein
METNAHSSVTKPAAAQSPTTTRDDLGRFTSFPAPPIRSSSSPDQFQVEPFQVEPFQVEPVQMPGFHDDKATAVSVLTVCPI